MRNKLSIDGNPNGGEAKTMNCSITLAVLPWLCFVHPASGSLNGVGTAQKPAQATEAVRRQYKLGETIRVRDGLTLKVVPGGTKSIELLSSKVGAEKTPFLLDLEFDSGQLVENAVCDFEFGSSVEDKGSPILLDIGEEKIGPEGSMAADVRGVALRDKAGKRHFMTWLHEGKTTVAILFGLTGGQLKEKKKLILNFGINMDKNETYSFVIQLD
jgi:hypothetical protein